jgi:hypothetical protein
MDAVPPFARRAALPARAFFLGVCRGAAREREENRALRLRAAFKNARSRLNTPPSMHYADASAAGRASPGGAIRAARRWRERFGRAEPTVRSRLVALVLCVVVPTLLVSVLATLRAWEAGRAATERMLTARAEALSSAVKRELEFARVTLQVLATSPHLATGDLAAFHDQVQAMPKPEGARIALTDEAGRMLLNSMRPFGTPLPPRGDLGVVARVFATGEPQVSNLYTTSMTQEPLVAVDVPVRLGGRVAYDLTMGFRVDALNRIMAEQRLAPGWIAVLVDGQGLLVARNINAERAVGRPGNPAALAAIAAGEPLFSTVSQEGVRTRAAQVAVPGTGWTAVVAVPVAKVEAPLRRTLLVAVIVNGGLLLTGLLAALWHARRIADPLKALSDGAAALGRGAARRRRRCRAACGKRAPRATPCPARRRTWRGAAASATWRSGAGACWWPS